jgi:hypothetical protein
MRMLALIPAGVFAFFPEIKGIVGYLLTVPVVVGLVNCGSVA